MTKFTAFRPASIHFIPPSTNPLSQLVKNKMLQHGLIDLQELVDHADLIPAFAENIFRNVHKISKQHDRYVTNLASYLEINQQTIYEMIEATPGKESSPSGDFSNQHS